MLLYTKERIIAMTRTKQALIWAAGIIAFAVFGAFGLVPQDVARYGVIALPALAAVSIFTQRPCAPCGKIRA
tara:strand:+ start:2070 stop:2285 length:216 start_codon:yes stop_codon:yes gene_type:complete